MYIWNYTIYVVYLAVGLIWWFSESHKYHQINVCHLGSKHGFLSIQCSKSPNKSLANCIFRANRQIFNSPIIPCIQYVGINYGVYVWHYMLYTFVRRQLIRLINSQMWFLKCHCPLYTVWTTWKPNLQLLNMIHVNNQFGMLLYPLKISLKVHQSF